MLFIFDMGGVVTNTFKMDSIYNKLNLSKTDFFDICKLNNHNIEHELNIGNISSAEFWKEFNNRITTLKTQDKFLQVPEVTTDLFRLFFHPSKNLQTIELVQALKKKHRVVCGTNTIQSHWENHMERGDYALFDQTYASNKIGLAKPDPAFWKTIMMAEGYEPSETYFTDDRLDNVEAAASLGIHAVQFTSADAVRKGWGL